MLKCDCCKETFAEARMERVKGISEAYGVCPYCGCYEIFDESELKPVNLLLTPNEYRWLSGIVEITAHLGECWRDANSIYNQLNSRKDG